MGDGGGSMSGGGASSFPTLGDSQCGPGSRPALLQDFTKAMAPVNKLIIRPHVLLNAEASHNDLSTAASLST